MSNTKSTISPDPLDNKSTTPSTATRASKKRTISSATFGDEADDALLDMDLGTPDVNAVSPMRPLLSDSPSPLQNQAVANPSSSSSRSASCAPLTLHANTVAARPSAPQSAVRQLFVNLPTCIRLSPAVPPGRMELVQTGIKLELAVSNLPRTGLRGLEEYVNERAAGFRERPMFSVDRIKIYSQAGEVVLFGKIGTAYDVRALHYLFCDLAKGSQLRYCPTTFPDLPTALANAAPWFNQGEPHTHVASFHAAPTSSHLYFSGVCARGHGNH